MTTRWRWLSLMRGIVLACVWPLCAGLAGAAETLADPLDMAARPVAPAMATRASFTALTRAGLRLVAAGWRGLIVYSDDGGTTWQQAAVPVSVDLTALSFPTPRAGWAVGHSGVILHSTDGGATWQRQIDGRGLATAMRDFYKARVAAGDADAQKWVDEAELSWRNGPEQPWLAVHFVDEQRGWVAGAFNLVAQTVDGGRSWTPLLDKTHNPEGLHLNALVQIGQDLYVPSEGGVVFKLGLGGSDFERIKTSYAGTFFGACAWGPQVVLYGLRGVAYVGQGQTDGAAWMPLSTGVKTAINGCGTSSRENLLVTQGGEVVAMGPGAGEQALTLKLQPSPGMGPLFDAVADGAGGWVVAGYKGLKRVAAQGPVQ